MSVVLSWRCIVGQGKSSSRLPPTNRLHSPSVSFSPFSSLPPSSSADFTTPLDIISDLLTKEAGFSSSQVRTVTRRSPRLLKTKSDRTAREAIRLMKDYGITENKLKNAILRNPKFLELKVDTRLKPKLEFLEKMGLTTQDVAHIVSRNPRVLSTSLENCLTSRILQLETLFDSRAHLCKALRTAPQLLTSNFGKQVKPKVEYLRNSIGVLECSPSFARALNTVLGFSLETLDAKVKQMASLGLGENEIGQILKVYPQALGVSTKKMKEKIDFLIHTAGLDPKIVASNSFIVGLSLEKRLKPRYKVFQSLRTSSHVIRLPSLVTFLRLSEKKILKYTDQCTTIKSTDHTIS